MSDKKIIDKTHVKENNPNDDEEILKNNEDPVEKNTTYHSREELKNKDEKSKDSKSPEFPGSM